MTGYDTASFEDALRPLLAGLGARPPIAVTRPGGNAPWPTPVAVDGEWLTCLVDLLRPRRGESPEVAVPRLRTLIRLLTTQPQHARAVGEHVAALLASRMHRILYAESGTLPNTGFWSALTQRVLGRLLPPAPSPEYLRDLVDEVFHRVDDHLWLEAIPLSDWRALFDVLGVDSPVFDTARQVCRRELREALRLVSLRLAALGSDAERLKVVFITVDPERDTPEAIAPYVKTFDPAFIGLTGSSAPLEKVYTDYGVSHMKRELPDSALGYTVDHSAYTHVIDKAGNYRLLFGYDTPVKDLTSDLQYLIRNS